MGVARNADQRQDSQIISREHMKYPLRRKFSSVKNAKRSSNKKQTLSITKRLAQGSEPMILTRELVLNVGGRL